MIIDVEEIPDDDQVNRLVDYPHKYKAAVDLIWSCVFEFPGGQHESTIWSKHAPNVHAIGIEFERNRQAEKPDHRYIGFLPIRPRGVREIRTNRGHGFSVTHMPEDERPYHAGIEYLLAAGSVYADLKKTDKAELKLALQKTCAEMVMDPRAAAAA